MTQVFISYRRQDDSHAAGRLYGELVSLLGRHRVFMDIDDIAPGADFVSVLEQRVANCGVLLAVICSGWLDAIDAHGHRRLDRTDDFVRIEIAAALQRSIPVVPVLMDGAQMPDARDLPDDLKLLSRRQAILISHNRFRTDVEQLVRRLSLQSTEPLKDNRHPEPTSSGPELIYHPQRSKTSLVKISPSSADVIAALDTLADGSSEFVIYDRGTDFIQTTSKIDGDLETIFPTTFCVDLAIRLTSQHREHFYVHEAGAAPNNYYSFTRIDRVKQLFLAWIDSRQLPSDVTFEKLEFLDNAVDVPQTPHRWSVKGITRRLLRG